jgi:hypothetical protein
MEQCHTAADFVFHLFCQMKGMKDIGDACFVHLAVMGIIGNLHGPDCQ